MIARLQGGLCGMHAPPPKSSHQGFIVAPPVVMQGEGGMCRRLYTLTVDCVSPSCFLLQELATVLWSLATLGHRPSPAWLSRIEQQLCDRVAQLSPQVSHKHWASRGWYCSAHT